MRFTTPNKFGVSGFIILTMFGLSRDPQYRLQMTQTPPAIVKSEFVFENAPFASAHASTIVQTDFALVVAWFGGTSEGNPDVNIWVSRFDGQQWSKPVEAADGIQSDKTRFPCWNPVLFQPSDGPLLLFYKIGPNPREWSGFMRTSVDNGRTWCAPIKLPDSILGPIRAKPMELADGTLLAGSSTEHNGWIVHMERFDPQSSGSDGTPSPSGRGRPETADWSPETLGSAKTWQTTGPLNDPEEFGAIQPTILLHPPSCVQILCRSRQGVVTESWSTDAGFTWTRMKATVLPNPNAGIDAVRLADGRFLLAYNPTTQGREKLAVAVSSDGKTWRSVLILEDSSGEYSYPAMIQTRDGLVHITYTWKRERIKHVVLDPSRM